MLTRCAIWMNTPVRGAVFLAFVACCVAGNSVALAANRARSNIYEATLEEQGQKTPEISTDELRAFLAKAGAIVFDARPQQEYANAHIPGSINLDEKQLGRFTQNFPDQTASIVVYSNGPFCDWARRGSEALVKLGYSKVSRYQLGLAVWRILGYPAETNLEGFRQVYRAGNSVIVDARSRAEYAAGTIPAAQSILGGEASQAKEDHRLSYLDANTRILVFANSAREARAVAEELTRNSYPNTSYFDGSYDELKRAKFFSERKPPPSNLDGLMR
jgi:rhodanese-related sulfurtransferase